MNGIIEIIEEDNKIYIVMEKKEHIIFKIDELIFEIEGILGEQVNALYETIPNKEITPPFTQEENKFQTTFHTFTNSIQVLTIPTGTISYVPEITENNQLQITSTSQNMKNIILFDQTVGSFKYKNNQIFNPTQPVQTITDSSSIQQISPTLEIDLQQTSITPNTNLQNMYKNIDDSNIQQTISTKEFDNQQNTTLSNNYIGGQNSIMTNISQKIPELPRGNVQSIFTSTSYVPAPAPLKTTSNVNVSETLLPPTSTSLENEIKKHSSNVHTRTRSAIIDEDFQRRRPIYDELQFNDDRYRGFRFYSKFC